MTRLPWRLIARAWKENPLLPSLLKPCRDLNSARLELRWLEEHARDHAREHNGPGKWKNVLQRYCRERSKGMPLQYILGSEFFGDLEIKCRPGVLIPRQETAAYVSHLVGLLSRNAFTLPSHLRVMDLCTGTGCIPLLLAHLFSTIVTRQGTPTFELVGADISHIALDLALENKVNLAGTAAIEFLRADILPRTVNSVTPHLLDSLRQRNKMQWDILISNPPYISPRHFDRVTARSVRDYEPKLALVPEIGKEKMSDDEQGDLFYPHILSIAHKLGTKILLVEVGDIQQAKRVATYAKETANWDVVEIWRDEPGAYNATEEKFGDIPVKGAGNGRSVLCYKTEGKSWLAR